MAFEFGNFDKFQIAILENDGRSLVDLNNNNQIDPKDDLLTGINFGGSINATINIGSKNVYDLTGRTDEGELSVGLVSGSIAVDPSHKVIQASVGYGPGAGVTFYQRNNTKLIGEIDVVQKIAEYIKKNIDFNSLNPFRWLYNAPSGPTGTVTVEPLIYEIVNE